MLPLAEEGDDGVSLNVSLNGWFFSWFCSLSYADVGNQFPYSRHARSRKEQNNKRILCHALRSGGICGAKCVFAFCLADYLRYCFGGHAAPKIQNTFPRATTLKMQLSAGRHGGSALTLIPGSARNQGSAFSVRALGMHDDIGPSRYRPVLPRLRSFHCTE